MLGEKPLDNRWLLNERWPKQRGCRLFRRSGHGLALCSLALLLTAGAALAQGAPLTGWPTGGRLTQAFGCSPYDSGIAGRDCPAEAPWFHDGIDIAAPPGQPVRAAMAGTVIFAGPDGGGPACGQYRGYGLGVVIDSGQGWQTLYAHLSQIEVTVGQRVGPKSLIGAVGKTGCASGPHLHFGLRYRGQLVDPQHYITD